MNVSVTLAFFKMLSDKKVITESDDFVGAGGLEPSNLMCVIHAL